MRLMPLCLGTLMLACTNNKAQLPKKSEKSPQIIPTKAKEEEKTQKSIRLLGEVVPQNRAKLGFRVGGFIETVQNKIGSVLKKGQSMAQLDQETLKLQYEAAEIRLEQAKTQSEQSERDYKREEALKEAQISSKAAFEKAYLTHKTAQAQYKQAQVDFALAQKNLKESTLKAPFDCTISRQMKYVGEMVSPGEAIFEVIEHKSPEVILDAPEAWLNKIQVGMPLELYIPALSLKTPGKVVRVLSVILPEKRVFQVIAVPSDPNVQMASGYFAEGIMTP